MVSCFYSISLLCFLSLQGDEVSASQKETIVIRLHDQLTMSLEKIRQVIFCAARKNNSKQHHHRASGLHGYRSIDFSNAMRKQALPATPSVSSPCDIVPSNSIRAPSF